MENLNDHQFVPEGELLFTCHRWVKGKLAVASLSISEEAFTAHGEQMTALVVKDLLKAIEILSKR